MAESTCRFCGGRLGSLRAKEHVIPQWLIKELGIAQKDLTPTHFSEEFEILHQRRHKVPALIEGKVCGACNNGWMSALEAAAMPLLRPLMEGTRGAVELTDEERFTVARWAAKTVYMLNAASNYRRIVSEEHFQQLHSSPETLPSGVHVFAQQHHDPESELFWLQSQTWIPAMWHDRRISEDDVREMSRRSYKFLLHFKKLMLAVAYWPEPDWNLLIWRGIHVPMYPRRGPVSYYGSDPVAFDWEHWRQAQGAFYMSIGVNRRDEGTEAKSTELVDESVEEMDRDA